MGYHPARQLAAQAARLAQSLGPMPASLQDRYVALYKTFADSWRVTDKTSLFVYAPGTSTKTFTDPDWPAEKPPCKLKPQFQIPGAPVLKGIPIAEAERICRGVIDKDLYSELRLRRGDDRGRDLRQGLSLRAGARIYGTAVQIRRLRAGDVATGPIGRCRENRAARSTSTSGWLSPRRCYR